jgi:hypothetical protein
VLKVKIGETEYAISVIPPRLAPHNALYGELLQRKPASVEEAESVGSTIAELITIILKATVQPFPPEQHHTQLFGAVTELTNKVLSQSFFPIGNKANSLPVSAAR